MELVERPWGTFEVIQTEEAFQIKRLHIYPGKRISLQSHKFRAEHWFVISGKGTAEIDGAELHVSPGDSVNVPVGSKHRLGCSSETSLIIVEIQTGNSFAESDIIRFEDDFGRLKYD
jgi:mannose-6-phosphate isomerase-like protein (cupin superfamily)